MRTPPSGSPPTRECRSSWRSAVASQDFTPAGDPTDLVAVLGLTVGPSYTLQNVDSRTALLFREAAAKPAAGTRAHLLVPGGVLTLKRVAGVGFWCWTAGDPCACVVTEAP